MEQIKVVFFSTASTYTGGAIMALLNIMPLLQNRGITPFFILKEAGALEEILRKKHIRYRVVRCYDWCIPKEKKYGLKNRFIWFVKSTFNLIAEFRIGYILIKEKANIYHLNCMYNGAGVKVAKHLHIPVIWHFREFVDMPEYTNVFVNSRRSWRVFNLADRIVCVSDYLRKHYEPYINKKETISVVYDGIDFDKFNNLKRNKERENLIIGLSGTAPIKGHEDAINAIGLLKKKGYTRIVLRIAGRWPKNNYNNLYYLKLKKIIQDNILEDQIEFIGMRENMNEFWNNCHIALVCSKYESFGLSALEAMACGTPLICSTTSISMELTDNGKNVNYYDTGNAEQLAERIENLILKFQNNSDMLIEQSAMVYVKRFSLRRSADELYEIIYGVI